MFEGTFKQMCIIEHFILFSRHVPRGYEMLHVVKPALLWHLQKSHCLLAACGSRWGGKSGGNQVCEVIYRQPSQVTEKRIVQHFKSKDLFFFFSSRIVKVDERMRTWEKLSILQFCSKEGTNIQLADWFGLICCHFDCFITRNE